MPAATTNDSLPYPVLSDPPNVPSDIQALAVAVDTVTVVGVPAGPVGLSGTVWTDICTVAFTLTVAQTVEVIGWARLLNTAAGQPSVALQILDGGTHLCGTGDIHMGGSGDAFGDKLSMNTGRRRVGPLAAGAHTLHLQGFKDSFGAITVAQNITIASQLIACTGIEATY